MSSVVLELQMELLKTDCDLLNALRKSHVIAQKLCLDEFDNWIMSELNGYTGKKDNIPDYRLVHGMLKGYNPYHGWVPVILQNNDLNKNICNHRMADSIDTIQGLYNKSKSGTFSFKFQPEMCMQLSQMCDAPFETDFAVFVGIQQLKSIIEKVKNNLLEWTIKLEKEGILGENMIFNKNEEVAAKSINNYYGNVIYGTVNESNVVSENDNNWGFDYDTVNKILDEVTKSLSNDAVNPNDSDIANELIEDIEEKVNYKRKPAIIRTALFALKDFLVNAGANITAELIIAKMQGLL